MSDSERPPPAAPDRSPTQASPGAPPEAAARTADRDGDPAAPPTADESMPTGAVIITTLLAIIILVFWFGMYALNLVRS